MEFTMTITTSLLRTISAFMWCLSLAKVVVLKWLRLLLIYLLLWLVQSHEFGNLLLSWYCSLEIGWYWIPVMVFATLPIQNGWLVVVILLSCCDAIFGVYLQSLDCARSKWSVPGFTCITTVSLLNLLLLLINCFCQNLNQMNLEQVSKFKYGS